MKCININFECVCNMDNQFKGYINLNSHFYVLGHCLLFSVKNLVFRLLDHIAPKLSRKIREKKIKD